MAEEFDIELDHHDPVSDAQAAGHLWIALAIRAGMPHTQLLGQHGYRTGLLDLADYKPFSNADKSSSRLSPKDFSPQSEPNPDDALFGKRSCSPELWVLCPDVKPSNTPSTQEPDL